MTRRHCKTVFAGLVAAMLTGPTSHAQDAWDGYKDSAFTFVVPFGAGGSTDAAARAMGEALGELGIEVVTVNRPGAGGVEGTAWVAEQAPDANIWGVFPPTAFYFLPSVEDVGYTSDDFEPVAIWSESPFVVAVREDAPWATLTDFLAYVKEMEGHATVGSTGPGTQYEYTVANIAATVDSSVTYVPFNDGASVMLALVGGHVDAAYVSASGYLPLAAAGEVRALVHTSPLLDRISTIPDVPGVTEFGMDRNVVPPGPLVLSAPKGTPLEVREAVAAAIGEAVKSEEVAATLNELGLALVYYDVQGTAEVAETFRNVHVPRYVEWYQQRD